MSTDRELLELAAKAAGYAVTNPGLNCFGVGIPGVGVRSWNPLVDDGDALRLAVKLRLRIIPWPTGKVAVEYPNREGFYGALAEVSGDPDAAVRRAIVRVAAAIGSGMP